MFTWLRSYYLSVTNCNWLFFSHLSNSFFLSLLFSQSDKVWVTDYGNPLFTPTQILSLGRKIRKISKKTFLQKMELFSKYEIFSISFSWQATSNNFFELSIKDWIRNSFQINLRRKIVLIGDASNSVECTIYRSIWYICLVFPHKG